MENIYENLPVLNKFSITSQQLAIENNIAINGEDEVAKVLSASARASITSCEALSGEGTISGNVLVNVVYVCQDGRLNNQTAVSPFVYKLSDGNIDTSSKLNIEAKVVSTQIDKFQDNNIKVLSMIAFDGVIVKNVETNYLKDGGEGTYVKQIEKEVVSLDKQNCETFTEDLEANVRDGVKKVLMTNVEQTIKSWTVGANFISVEGEIYAKVLYANAKEPSELQTITIAKAYKQEIEVDDVNKDCNLDVFAHIVHENVNVELDEKENGETTIRVNVPIMACYNVYRTNNILAVEDIYSTENVLAVEQGECTTYTNLQPELLEGKVEGNVMLTDDEPRVDKYLATTNVCTTISNCYVSDDTLFVEGVVSANVVYLNDELGAIQSVEIEIPYVLDKKIDFTGEVILQPSVALSDVDVMIKRGREIFFDAKAKAFVNVTLVGEMCMVTKAQDLGKLPERDSALEIFFARAGQSFWEIAKSLKIPQETIMSQNPNLTDPLEEDENIAVYYQKHRKVENK